MQEWGGPPGMRPSGNRVFDEYRSEALRKLEEEAKEFRSFLERLRMAKDRAEFDDFMARWGWPRFFLTGFLLVNMWAVVAKMLLRHVFNIKYVMVLNTPYFSISI